MKKWPAIISIVMVFILGASAGAIVMRVIDQRGIERAIRGEPGIARELIVRRLSRRLDLDPGQVDRLRAIVTETHGQIRELRKQLRPQMEQILNRSQDRIRSILRPDQLAKYEKIVAGRKRRMEQKRHGK